MYKYLLILVLILFCLLTVNSSATTSATLQLTSCTSPCTMIPTQPGYYHLNLMFSGTGYDSKTNYAACTYSPDISWCSGLYNAVSSGVLNFSVGVVHAGSYTTQVFKQTSKGLVAVSPIISYELVYP